MANMEKVCEKCGTKWTITQHSTITRDTDECRCSCGEVLIEWNGAVFYTARKSPIELTGRLACRVPPIWIEAGTKVDLTGAEEVVSGTRLAVIFVDGQRRLVKPDDLSEAIRERLT